MAKKASPNTICDNRRARFNYELLEFYEGGLVLTGGEVKSLRAGAAHISEAYASFVGDELFLIGAHIAQYKNTGYTQHDERRSRKILLHKKQLKKLKEAREQKSLTIVPLRIFWKKGLAKVDIALARGKKTHDKRETIKQRDWDRQKHRILKNG